MDATPLLVLVGRTLADVGLDAVLIGNAAAALQGAPVTTVDLDFLFRKSPRNMQKLKALAARLGATILRPYYPASDLYRVVRDDDGLQLDFMTVIHGVRSFEGLRARASQVEIEGVVVVVAALDDIIRSKRAAGRARDLAVLDVLEKARAESSSKPPSPSGRARKRE
jgi:predicted nucleotidyltransferase